MSEWKIVDVNYLRATSVELESFLRADPSNRVVLNEYACMESYKGNAIKNIQRSVELLCRYAPQVVVLKGAMEIIGMQSSQGVGGKDFVDDEQTREFPRFCNCVRFAKVGDKNLQSQILLHGAAVTVQLERIRKDSTIAAQFMLDFAQSLDPEICKQFRKRHFPPEAAGGIVKKSMELAAHFFAEHPRVQNIPNSIDELFGTFIFRYSLLGYLLAVHWISDGGLESVSQEKLTNDLVDMNYVVYATFFDGLLTHDRKCLHLYEEATAFLAGLAVH